MKSLMVGISMLTAFSVMAADGKCKIAISAEGLSTSQASLVSKMTSKLQSKGCEVATTSATDHSGSYSLSQSGSAVSNYCASVMLSISENGNAISGTGSNGQCTETLQGIESNGVITVSSFTETLSSAGTYSGYSYGNFSCNYAGSLTVANNIVTGTLTSASGSYGAAYCAPITIAGTKVSGDTSTCAPGTTASQYGCLAQQNCPVGYGSYNNVCIPVAAQK